MFAAISQIYFLLFDWKDEAPILTKALKILNTLIVFGFSVIVFGSGALAP